MIVGIPWQIRFWRQVDKAPGFGPWGDCWRWTGHCAPYGRLEVDGVRAFAHRASYALHYGSIKPGPGYHGTVVRHRCDNPACVNPAHLLLGEHRQNIQDRDDRGRQSRGPAHQRLRQGEKHGQAKLTADDVRAIRADPRLYRDIADDFAIAESYVCNLKSGRRWTHLLNMEPNPQ